MYTPVSVSVAYGRKTAIAIEFEHDAFKELIKKSIVATNLSIQRFESDKAKLKNGESIEHPMSLEDLMGEIGIFVEIIKNAVFLSFKFRTIQFDDVTEEKIKEIIIKLHTWILAVGISDNDFFSRPSTQRANPTQEMADYVKNNW
ncbi:MAG: hypothetical protein WCJ45_07320 [bacterium]